ncbi:MAG TPA: hypothetical protein VFA10_18010 [Ktedonobacteraceae bacterium]|nr:hypothetical protein [Ktedonobacteraceae bacterium]
MELDDIKVAQESCERNYDDAPTGSPNEAAWMQNRLLAEIALQLAKMNEHLESIRSVLGTHFFG